MNPPLVFYPKKSSFIFLVGPLGGVGHCPVVVSLYLVKLVYDSSWDTVVVGTYIVPILCHPFIQ